MKPPKEYLKNLKHHTITEKMLSDCIYSINNRALNSRDNEYKYTQGSGKEDQISWLCF